jgi:large subunit ribosomal protein L11
MAKKKKTIVKLQIKAGKASPAPPIGPMLAQHGINMQEFCQDFNDKTSSRGDDIVPVELTVYQDGSYDFILKEPPASQLIKRELGIKKGSGEPNKNKIGTINRQQLEAVAKKKMPDLNTNDLDAAVETIKGTAKNMGLRIKK